MLADCISRVNGDLVFRLVTLLNGEVVVLERDVEIRVNEPVLDELPNDPRHFVAVELDYNAVYLDFFHARPS